LLLNETTKEYEINIFPQVSGKEFVETYQVKNWLLDKWYRAFTDVHFPVPNWLDAVCRTVHKWVDTLPEQIREIWGMFIFKKKKYNYFYHRIPDGSGLNIRTGRTSGFDRFF
jgi:hypothetical protein